MDDQVKTNAQLIAELTQLRERVAELETAQAARQQADKALAQQNDELSKLQHFSVALSMLSSEDNLEAFIAKQLKEIAGAEAAVFAEYDPANRTTTPQHIEMDPGRLEKVIGLLGKQMKKIHSDVSDEMYREMTTEMIGVRKTLHEASFGSIPRPVGAAIQALLKVDRFIGVAYLIEGKLYGTSLLAMGKDRPNPPKRILENFASLAAVSLRRKLAEAALRESERNLRRSQEIARIGHWIMNSQTNEFTWSDEMFRIFGVEPAEFTGDLSQVWRRAILPEDLERVDAARHVMTGKQRRATLEYRVARPDGSIRHILAMAGDNLTDRHGNLVQLTGIVQDITDRKQAEEQLQRYEFIVNAATESMTLINRQHVFEAVNAAYCRAHGRSRAELIGHSLAEVWGETRYREKILPYLEECFAGQIVRYEDTFPFEGGEPRYYEIGLYPYSAAPGDPVTYAVIVTFDITDRKRAEEALRESHTELQTRNEELDAFAHMVAHDLKTPLGIMMSYAQLLIMDYSTGSTDMIQQSLMTISRNGRKAANIIESLFLLASVRKQDVPAVPLDMAHIVEEVLLRLADSIRDSGADLRVPDCVGWPVALGHAPWIEEIWVNYLSNAIKYGGPRPRIDLGAARQPDGFIRFSVRDHGVGLTPEQQERLFVPFERLGQARVEGHGLGLSVVRRIADKLGGQVGVNSTPGQGSTFYFTLPAATDLMSFDSQIR